MVRKQKQEFGGEKGEREEIGGIVLFDIKADEQKNQNFF